MLTNAEYLKKSLLTVETKVYFQLNLGTALDTAVDITDYVKNISSLKEKLTKSAYSTGGVVLPSLTITLDDSWGRWHKDTGYFKNGFVNNSLIYIETYYNAWTERGEFSEAFNPLHFDVGAKYRKITPSFKYKGLIKHAACSWSRNGFTFKTKLIPHSSLFATEKVAKGILSNDTFSNICYQMLNRQPFTKYFTIDQSNFSFGWDVAATDSVTTMVEQPVKEVLDNIMLLTGSVYYVNYDQELIIEPIETASPSAVCTLRGDDMDINTESYNWKEHYTAIVWDDGTNAIQRKDMSYTDRENFQYDYIELTLNQKYVTDTTNRSTILDNLYDLYKYLKRKITLTCKWNPEILVNKYISLDVPQEAIIGDQYLTWNKDQWNDGKKWGMSSRGISFNSNDLWRVLDIRRSVEGEKMQITVVQHQSDDEK